MHDVDVQAISEEFQEFHSRKSSIDKQALTAAGVAGGLTLAVVAQPPAKADGVADVSAMVTSLGTLAAGALAVALVPIGVFFAIRIVKRVMNA